MNLETRKRTFVGLLLAALILLGLLVYYLWHLTFFKSTFYSQIIFIFLIVFLVGLVGITFLGLCGIFLAVFKIPLFPSWQRIIRMSVNIFYPFIIQLGRVFKITQDKIQRSFIELNNYLLEIRSIRVQPRELLLLLPHCLQQSECSYRINIDITNCRNCGNCMIGSLMNLAEKYRIKVKVVTGGTLARKEIEMLKPKAIIAVACERDLSSGILEASPLPVLGISNERPHGPCHNTRVDLKLVEEGIKFFLQG